MELRLDEMTAGLIQSILDGIEMPVFRYDAFLALMDGPLDAEAVISFLAVVTPHLLVGDPRELALLAALTAFVAYAKASKEFAKQ